MKKDLKVWTLTENKNISGYNSGNKIRNQINFHKQKIPQENK